MPDPAKAALAWGQSLWVPFLGFCRTERNEAKTCSAGELINRRWWLARRLEALLAGLSARSWVRSFAVPRNKNHSRHRLATVTQSGTKDELKKDVLTTCSGLIQTGASASTSFSYSIAPSPPRTDQESGKRGPAAYAFGSTSGFRQHARSIATVK